MAFFYSISRVAVGTIALGSFGPPALRVASTIAARYSMRRTVVDPDGRRKPIIEFRTQKTPIITALAQSFVLDAMHARAIALFRDVSADFRVRHAMAAIHKVTMIQHAQAANLMLGDRCGAQGLFEVNQITAIHVSLKCVESKMLLSQGLQADMRGSAIAEGDLLGISIRTLIVMRNCSFDTNSDS